MPKRKNIDNDEEKKNEIKQIENMLNADPTILSDSDQPQHKRFKYDDNWVDLELSEGDDPEYIPPRIDYMRLYKRILKKAHVAELSLDEGKCWEKYMHINVDVKSIDDIILLGKIWKHLPSSFDFDINIDLWRMKELRKPLIELRNMIGMEEIKESILFQILFYSQNLDERNKDLLHTVIEGPPGVGKTKLAKILAKLYVKLGVLTNDKVMYVKRSQLIGGYLGQTAIKTQKILDKCEGGVLFIDEAYSLGNEDTKDHYSKECIDTLTAHLTEKQHNFVCIIAGYKEALDKCFFAYNAGLERRFPYRFGLKEYKPKEMHEIFECICREQEWKVGKNSVTSEFFEKNKNYFKFNGGDMEILFHKAKLSHSKRIFGQQFSYQGSKIITDKDVENGLELLLKNPKFAERKNLDEFYKTSYMYT